MNTREHWERVYEVHAPDQQRLKYVRRAASAVRPGGHVIVGTLGPEGPNRCSGLEVSRYDAPSLHGEFGPGSRPIASSEELHQTPLGATQQFLYYCYSVVEES